MAGIPLAYTFFNLAPNPLQPPTTSFVFTHSNMINPHHISRVKCDCIATPDVLRVDISESDVLYNNVRCLHDADTLSLDGGSAAGLANQGLVASDGNTLYTSIVIRYRHAGRIGLVVLAPAVLVDGDLASAGRSPGGAARGGGGTLSAGEIVRSIEDDDTGFGVA